MALPSTNFFIEGGCPLRKTVHNVIQHSGRSNSVLSIHICSQRFVGAVTERFGNALFTATEKLLGGFGGFVDQRAERAALV